MDLCADLSDRSCCWGRSCGRSLSCAWVPGRTGVPGCIDLSGSEPCCAGLPAVFESPGRVPAGLFWSAEGGLSVCLDRSGIVG
jgi:hypothetical protein